MFSKRFEKAAFKTASERKCKDALTERRLMRLHLSSYFRRFLMQLGCYIDDWIETQKRYDETDAKYCLLYVHGVPDGRAIRYNLII